jgi:nucleoside-diphosphate-sugar epimerase
MEGTTMMLTMITGAPGWIGTRLVRTLLQGTPDGLSTAKLECQPHVRCLVMPGLDASALCLSDQLEIFRGDLRNLDAVRAFCRGAEGATLFHCAGVVHPLRFVREFMEVNVRGTQHLLHAAEDVGVRRVVVLSSNSPAGVNPRRDHRFDEGSPYNPYMSYGRSKMLMEQAVHEVQARGRLETVILRPTWFYGPDQPERQTTFFRMIKNGTVPIVGDGENLRSMTYIDNLCQAMLLSEHNPVANGQTYWVADSRPYSMNEIVDTVERLMETEFGIPVAHKRLRLPSLAGSIAHLSDGMIQKLGLYHQKIHVLSEMDKTIACSVEKARRELGYVPTIDLEEGVRRSIAWCLAQGMLL